MAKRIILQKDECPDALFDALVNVRRELADFLGAIEAMGLADRFVDDSCNMISQGETALREAEAALAKA